MRKIIISKKKATRTHLTAGVVAVLVLLCVRMDSVLSIVQALVPTSSMVGQEVFVIIGIVGLWYMIWGGIIASLVVRVVIRLLALYIK